MFRKLTQFAMIPHLTEDTMYTDLDKRFPLMRLIYAGIQVQNSFQKTGGNN